jgi:hypothetical protein
MPRVSPLHSQVAFSHSPAVSFLTSPTLGSFSRGLPSRRVLPDANAHFVTPFGVFLWLIAFLRNHRSHPYVLIHSSNQCLLATAIRPSSKPA